MKLLCFQARHFGWKSFSKNLDEIGGEQVEDVSIVDELKDCVVVFAHAERADEPEEARARVFRHTLKHIKWLANKRDYKNVVLHSFAHLGYTVKTTPFGYFCEWNIDVHGESLAKVYKQI